MDRKEQCYLEVSRQALRHNAAQVADFVKAPVIAVVKCDGYGVGLEEAARAWEYGGATMFAVAEPEEALRLRELGFEEDILLLSPVADGAVLELLVKQGIILTVTGLSCAQFYLRCARGRPVRVHVAVDTGMGRFGFRWTDREGLLALYQRFPFQFEGIFSHFAAAFEKRYRRTRRQLNRFLEITDFLRAQGCPVGTRHIANSCAALRFPDTWLDAVRIGSALVGPLCRATPVPLLPAAAVQAQVVDRKLLRRGDCTGYASVCRVRRDTCAAVVALGHVNGFGMLSGPDRFGPFQFGAYLLRLFRRRLRGECVEYQGRRLPLVGRVGSQYTLFAAGEVCPLPGEYVTAQVHLLQCRLPRRYV